MSTDRKANILIVDDDPIKTAKIKSIISGCGENIITCESGRDALRFLLSNETAVILLDVNMPGMDGFETASLIRKRKQTEFTPIIFITAYNLDATEVTKGYSLGAVDYLFTPVVPEILLAKVKVFIDLFKMNNQIKKDFEQITEGNKRIQLLHETLKEHADKLERQALLLEQTNKDLESFTYSVSHDLRAPLRHIKGYVDLLEESPPAKLNAKEKRYLQNISETTLRMENIIDHLLHFSRLGRSSLEVEMVNLNELLNEIINEMKSEVVKRNISWKISSLPSVIADYSLLKLALINLLSNALKFTSKREVTEIEIAYVNNGKEFTFSIKDNGVGFNMEFSNRLFNVFQRLHPTTEFEGIGIGLANVKKIISLHGGKVWAEGEVNKGAVFYFTLPVKE